MKTKHLLALALLLCGVTPLLPAQDAAPATPPTEDRRRIKNIAAPGTLELPPQPPIKIEQREIKTSEMRDIQLHSNGRIRFTVGETQYFFNFPVIDASHPVNLAMSPDFSACVALLAELRKTDRFTISFEMRTDIPEEKTIHFSDLTISVRSLVEPARPIIAPPRVP